MKQTTETPSLEDLKRQAKRLRQALAEKGTNASHGETLEIIARQYGARDWNTMRARTENQFRVRVGDRVAGRYLGQPFQGEVKSLTVLGNGSHRRITLHFDHPVDVVKFESFSALRQRVSGLVGWDGRSPQKTSDGAAQLVLEKVLA